VQAAAEIDDGWVTLQSAPVTHPGFPSQLVAALEKEGAEIMRQELKEEVAHTIASGTGWEEAVKV
jgi:hypothetical protein